jgi:hypothetical protein
MSGAKGIMSNPFPLATCSQCQTLLQYCPGCGANVRETYKDGKTCARCGASFSHCTTCGSELTDWTNQVMELAPSAEKEFVRFCPACGEKIWDVADQCPRCKVNIRGYMDRVYSLTYDRVNQVTMEEEAQLERADDKDAWKKAKHQRIASERMQTLQMWALILVLLIIVGLLLWAVLYVMVFLFPKNV